MPLEKAYRQVLEHPAAASITLYENNSVSDYPFQVIQRHHMRPRVEERIRVLLILLVFQTRRRRKGGTIWKEFFSRARYDAKQHRTLMKIPWIFIPAEDCGRMSETLS